MIHLYPLCLIYVFTLLFFCSGNATENSNRYINFLSASLRTFTSLTRHEKNSEILQKIKKIIRYIPLLYSTDEEDDDYLIPLEYELDRNKKIVTHVCYRYCPVLRLDQLTRYFL